MPNQKILHVQLIETAPEVKEYYQNAVDTYNTNPNNDSGFDIICASNQTFPPNACILIRTGIMCQPMFHGGYFMAPRSSIYKSGFIFANSIGIIDNGYRGELMIPLLNVSGAINEIKVGMRLAQIVMPELLPFKIAIVNSLEMTQRGYKGLGSSGLYNGPHNIIKNTIEKTLQGVNITDLNSSSILSEDYYNDLDDEDDDYEDVEDEDEGERPNNQESSSGEY